MKTRQVIERIGENLGPIDWSYDFLRHFDGYCGPDTEKAKRCEQRKEWLRQAEASLSGGPRMEMTTYGGWPRCGWGIVIDVGMYDGWPYWKPTPSILITGPLGPEWHCFAMYSDARAASPTDAGQEQ